MNPLTPTLRQLEYAAALARTLNFRVAAEVCHVSQPALSAQIQQLESLLGVKLFERDKRRVLLTDSGRLVVDHIDTVLDSVEGMLGALRARNEPFSGPLHLGVIPTIAPFALPIAVPLLRESFPQLELFLVEDQTPRLVEQLEAAELDVALLALEASLGSLATLPVGEEPFFVAAPLGHEFEALDEIPESALIDEAVLLLREGHCLRTQTLSLCDRVGVGSYAGFEATSLTTLLEMVAGGMGITLVPAMALRQDTGWRRRLVVRPFADPQPGRTLGLAFRASSPREEEFRRLAEVLAGACL
ncbi:MAG: DNA-binding transcriptional regulator OxyR [Planctomycetota bacterium]|nr:MAG: DNA-binding transcriptional regulator OxyR [Planctomycetota bacterium]